METTDESTPRQALLRQAIEGNANAAARLLELYRSYLRLLARVYVGRDLRAKADPSDLVQEAFVYALKCFSEFRGTSEAELIQWLKKILASSGAQFVRHYKGVKQRNVNLERQLEHRFDQTSMALEKILVASASSPSQQAVRHESVVILAEAIDRLSPDYREVIVTYHLVGLSIADVARRMDRSVASVKSLRARALLKLRTYLKDQV